MSVFPWAVLAEVVVNNEVRAVLYRAPSELAGQMLAEALKVFCHSSVADRFPTVRHVSAPFRLEQ